MAVTTSSLHGGPIEPDAVACFVVPYHPDQSRSAAYLREAVESIVAQSDNQWRLVIVHDPLDESTDSVSSAIETLLRPIAERSTVLHLDCRRGPGSARNAGVDWAITQGADLVLFLDADDVCEPSRLAASRAALDANPRAGLVYSSFAIIDEHSQPRPVAELPQAIAEIFEDQADRDQLLRRPWREMACQRGYMSLTSTVAVRVSVALRCRFPATMVSEDTHAWLRMFAICEEVVYLADRLTRYRVPRIAQGSASRARSDGLFYWTKTLVDADACFRVLLGEAASGAIGHAEALELLDAFWRRTGATMERAGADAVGSLVTALAAVEAPVPARAVTW